MSETQTDPAAFDEAAEVAAYEAEQQEAAPPAAEAAEAAPEPERAPKHVPLAVLMQEREAHRREREERQRLQAQFEQGNKRLEMLISSLQQPQRPADPVPDINTDPVGYFQRQLEATQRELAEVKQFKEQVAQQSTMTAQEAQFLNAYRTDAMAFAQKAPDFTGAYNHFKEMVIRDALETGADPEEAIAEMEARERQIVARALRTGKSPAEAVYNAARRYGFKGAAPTATADAKMEAMQRGQTAAKSTAAPGGARGRFEGLTVEALANMSEAEFSKVPESIVNRLLGANR